MSIVVYIRVAIDVPVDLVVSRSISMVVSHGVSRYSIMFLVSSLMMSHDVFIGVLKWFNDVP